MKILRNLVLVAVVFNLWVSTAHAQLTILPGTNLSIEDCNSYLDTYEQTGMLSSERSVGSMVISESIEYGDLLGCAIKTGRITLNMVPFFIKYIINFLLAISGMISVLFILIGGYYYIYGSVVDDKEKGKSIIFYALGGMALAFLSWSIVNIVLALLTS